MHLIDFIDFYFGVFYGMMMMMFGLLLAMFIVMDNEDDEGENKYQTEKTIMTELSEFEQLVREMRTAQRAYFRSRSSDALETSKRLEREVDAFIKFRLEAIEKARLEANMEFDFGGDK